MNANSVSGRSLSKPEAINQSCSTVCSLCGGIGEEGHPRSKITNWRHSERFSSYIYLHYPDPELLRSSYERHGCQTCRLILSCIQHESTGMVVPTAVQAQDDRDRLASFDIEQDTNDAARILKSAEVSLESDGLGDGLKVQGCSTGRVVLWIAILLPHREDGGPRADFRMRLKVKDVGIHIFDQNSVATRVSAMQMMCSPG